MSPGHLLGATLYQLPVLDGSETSNLGPPFRVAANFPPTLTEAQQRRLSDNAPGANLRGMHQYIAFTFSKKQTSRLLAACKAAAATVTHVFHAATAVVVRDIQERPPTTSRVRKSLTVDMVWRGAGDSDASQESGRNNEFLDAVQIMKGPPPVPPPKTKPSVSISSMGRIDPIIKPTLGVTGGLQSLGDG
ncbi:hypothetical protein DL768_001681 [Monosporascus sp. mg162]|nr:hypothetical protein DL768_001681 [Monosporascus sp. mg162]